MQSDDENVTVGQKHSCKVAIRDLEAGLYIDNISYMDEEEKLDVDICKDENNPDHVEATHEDKEVLLNAENKPGVDLLEKEAEVHGLRKRRVAKVDTVRSVVTGDSAFGRMPEEERRGAAIANRMKDVPFESGPETKQKPLDKKTGKQAKGSVKPAGRRGSDGPPLEDFRVKEDAETNRKVHESLDNFIRQTIRCEPYMTFSGRPGDKPLQRLRSDVFENHVGGKFGRGFKVEGGSDARDIIAEDNISTDGLTSDVDGLKETPLSGSKGIGGLGRGPQHSLKVPPGVVAFTQAAAKGTDLPGWPLSSPSKMTLTKCDKCSREFCSSLNYRRHVRVHRKTLTEKKDLSKERSKVAEFWDKLTPEQASVIVNYENMEIEDLSGNSLLKALAGFIQQPGMPSMPSGLMKAGSALLDIVQNKPSVYPLPSERLLSILDDASEKTFLTGGASGTYPRVVFNGDAGKVGLEEKNLVASMGFHVELRLVKAWMADKEAEALRNQQALFKEEEAAQQKRAKLLEKRRMKKIRQKERKVTASQLVQELENESLDDEGNIPGVEEDDSPTATGSSVSSLVSAHDLAMPGTSDLDMNEDIGQVEGRDEQPGLAGEPVIERNKVREEDTVQLPKDISSPGGIGKSMFYNPEDSSDSFVSVSRKGDYHSFDHTVKDKEILSRNLEEAVQDIDRDSRMAQQVTYNRSGRPADVQTGLHSRKGDQERITSDFRRRESDRSVVERKPLRISRDRTRIEYPEVFQKPGRDTKGYDTRYVDGPSQSTFKPVRKANSFALKSDSGTSDLAVLSRTQQYRSKPPGMHRTTHTPIAGNGQVVWTRKVSQPAVVELCKDRKEEVIQDDKLANNSLTCHEWELQIELTDAVELASESTGAPEVVKPDREDTETKEATTTSAILDVKPGNELKAGGLAEDTTFVFGQKELDNDDDTMYSGALLVGSLSVPIGKFATEKFGQSRNYRAFRSASDLLPDLALSPAPDGEGNDLGVRPQPSVQPDDASLCIPRLKLTVPESSDGPSENVGSDLPVPVVRPNLGFDQGLKLKPQSPTSIPDRAESGRPLALPPGQDRLAVKPGSWQTSAGRYVTAKVWRAVGLVGERQDAVPGVASAGDGEARILQEETDTLDGNGADGLLVKKDAEMQSRDDDASVVLDSNSVEYSGDQAFHTSTQITSRPVDSEADVPSNGATQSSFVPVTEDGADTAALVSDLCSLSVFLEVAERFLSERWRVAIAQASPDEYVDYSAEGISKVAEVCNMTEMLSQQLSGKGMRHHSGADPLPCSSSSVVTQSLGKTAHDGGVFLSRIFNDSDQTGMEDVSHQTTHDDQRLDGAGSQECRMPQVLSSEEDSGMRDSLSSPIDCEQFISGTENFRSYIGSAAQVGRVHGSERHSESRGGGGGSLGYSHARHSSSRQERWYRNPRDRFPEQRYMPRRRAPVEKNC
ncbi:protein MpC2H2-1 [Marchantia polymorpha subsp. ruderalis]|uniref:C2H2-type domain-containing protein n=2 Tax=Marchantia polymorpha TaxID=3197 RepID=A0AAF6BYR5_MARPO|nr:hypothetical protein MARPO_0003s0245 [Marchantia polymorpha]BBN17149.1 hypothetical protein Mp_7g12340 [Marchantia polymorpha subsp. ruderalis]|eukprot:PTQ49385.1 hypothetical protein MARPO_0003s0245 [Marchantia polymorpha]